MAKLIIDIINPTINLFSKPSQSSNRCEGYYEFTVKSTPNASITVAATYPVDDINSDTLREVAYDAGAGYVIISSSLNDVGDYPFITDNYIKRRTFTLNSTGTAKVRVTLPNSGTEGEYLTTTIYVRDNTNAQEDQKDFTRYNDDVKCVIGKEPVANDDTYTVVSGTSSNLNILSNDTGIGFIDSNFEVVITSQPTHGTAVYEQGHVVYTNNGDGTTTDSFTYTLQTNNGIDSATVNITIDQSTNINSTTIINFHTSGDGQGEEALYLQDAIDNELKTALLPSYGTEQAYIDNVKITNNNNGERFIKTMAEESIQADTESRVISIFFESNAWDDYHNEGQTYVGMTTYSENEALTSEYKTDIDYFKSTLTNWNKSNYHAAMLVPYYPDTVVDNFLIFLEALKEGLGNYSGDNGLEQFNNFTKITDVDSLDDGDSPTSAHYANKIIEALNNLGFNI